MRKDLCVCGGSAYRGEALELHKQPHGAVKLSSVVEVDVDALYTHVIDEISKARPQIDSNFNTGMPSSPKTCAEAMLFGKQIDECRSQ